MPIRFATFAARIHTIVMVPTSLQRLREIAIRLDIQAEPGSGGAVDLEVLIEVLNKLNQSYRAFIRTELKRLLPLDDRQEDQLNYLLEGLRLKMVDLQFGSARFALAPDLFSDQIPLFKDEIEEARETAFADYKDLISTKYSNREFIDQMSGYTEEQRRRIFKPLVDLGKKDYRINVRSKTDAIVRTLQPPSRSLEQFYVPRLSPAEPAENPETTTVVIYVEVPKSGDRKIDRKALKNPLYYRELEHPIYPYALESLQHEDLSIEFHEPLEAQVSFDESRTIYIIENKELNIRAKASDRDTLEERFREKLFKRFERYYFGEKRRLTPGEEAMKEELFRMTKSAERSA